VARLEALRDDAPRLQAALDEMRALVPKTNEVPSFIFAVQEAADQAGVGFLQITPELPKPPPEGAELAEVRATIGAEGGYFAVQDFIRRLYDLDRAVRIDGVTMTGIEDEESADDASVSVQLVARIFFDLPEGASAATTGTTTTTTTPPTTTP
jgi:Tfp pilus assembly protein PilO